MRFSTALLIGIGILQGGYMIFDGIHRMRTGSFFGGQPGPWAMIVRAIGVDPNGIAPVFVCLGILWLAGCAGLLTGSRWGSNVYLAAAVLTLLYLPIGTVLSIIALIVLWNQRQLIPGRG